VPSYDLVKLADWNQLRHVSTVGKHGISTYARLRILCTARSESRCAIINDVGSDVHERRYRPEPNLPTVA
jgi:hypothetical protein